ncbi:MAG: FCD domain-containing protein [Hyphomicrobiales bacterium]|nr:FCD domain-containing protein [Hyphomicrobiales bacterium]
MAPRMPRNSSAKPHSLAAINLGRRIVAGEWAVGSTIPTEVELSREFGLSRPSLREAIKVLCGKGLLTAVPRVGTIVRPKQDWNRLDPDVLAWQAQGGLNERMVLDLFELRGIFEPPAAALAALKATPEARRTMLEDVILLGSADKAQSIAADIRFHRTMLEATGNQFLAAMFPVIEACLAASFQVSRADVLPQEHLVPMHMAIARAIADSKAEAAEAAMQALLSRSLEDALNAIHIVQP